jgi:hypothetical protein
VSRASKLQPGFLGDGKGFRVSCIDVGVGEDRCDWVGGGMAALPKLDRPSKKSYRC